MILATGNPVAMAVSLASQVGIGYMNYRKTKASSNLEYEEQMWKLQRAALEQFNGLRRELFDTAWRLAKRFKFEDRFRLTEKQIRDDIDWLRSHEDSLDTRYTELDEAVSPKNRELAIAFGAALNANNIVVIKKQFPYTLCFYGETYATDINGNRIKKNGKDVLVANEAEEFIMFRENEEYIPGKPVFFGIQEKDENGNKVLRRIAVSGESIPYIRRRRKNKKPSPAKQPTYELAIPKNDDLYLAMAMERNENLTLYVYSQNVFDSLSKEEQESPINKALIGEPKSFPNIDKLLGSLIV
jgi:hypothetical protein